MMTIPHVQPGRLSKAEQDRLIDQVNANTPVGAAGAPWQSGTAGSVLGLPPRGGQPYQYFELYDSLAPGGYAEAYPMEWDEDSGLYVTDLDADTFTVYDVGGRFRGRARSDDPDDEDDSDGLRGKHGSQGMAVERNGNWEIEWLQPHATWIVCLVYDKFETDTTWILVDTVSVIGPTDQALLMESVTQAKNIFEWSGGEGQTLMIQRDDANGYWVAVQKDCGSGVASGA